MIKRGLSRVLISVSDIEASLNFFRDQLNLSTIEDRALDSKLIEQLWNLPSGTQAHSILLKKNSQTTMLELIEFSPTSNLPIRQDAKTYDYGIFDVAIRAKNVDATYEKLKRLGYNFLSPPISYSANWINLTVKENVVFGPDLTPVAFIQRLSGEIPVFEGDYDVLLDSAQFVRDIDEVSAFYGNVLGLSKLADRELPDGVIDPIVRLPQGTKSRIAFFNTPGANTALLEFIQTSAHGKSLADATRPPNLGIFAIGFEVEDIAAAQSQLVAQGIRLWSEPLADSFVVEGPNGELLLFYK